MEISVALEIGDILQGFPFLVGDGAFVGETLGEEVCDVGIGGGGVFTGQGSAVPAIGIIKDGAEVQGEGQILCIRGNLIMIRPGHLGDDLIFYGEVGIGKPAVFVISTGFGVQTAVGFHSGDIAINNCTHRNNDEIQLTFIIGKQAVSNIVPNL